MIEEIRELLNAQHAAIFEAKKLGIKFKNTYHYKIDDLHKEAENAFVKLNGWIIAKSSYDLNQFVPKEHRKPNPCWSWKEYVDNVSDHDFICREPQKPYRIAAVVCQPYNDHVTEATIAARNIGLISHTPPNPYASFWFPGWTQFIVFTKPGIRVNWLEGQLNYKTMPQRKES